jgi:hypothetical protein
MNALERFLATDPRGPGCAETERLLPVYVDAELAGDEPERRHPEVAAHLRACPPCEEERRGLLAACISLA